MNLVYAANFVLNKCQSANSYKIYPDIYDLTNRISSRVVTTGATFPDVTINTNEELKMNLNHGSFQDVCQELGEGSIDCVASWFFLDTAQNVVEYVSLIKKVLKPNGTWINMGGLDYMYEQFDSETSIELPLDDMMNIIKSFGFIILKNKTIENYEVQEACDSLLRKTFNCPFFICKKSGKIS